MDLKQKLHEIYQIANQNLEYFSLTGQEKRDYQKYIATYNYYKNFHSKELKSRYSKAKVEYAHKKNVLSLLLAALALAVMYSLWRGMFSVVVFVLKAYWQNGDMSKEMLLATLGVATGFILTASVVLFGVVYAYTRKIRRLHRRILIIEDILNEEDMQEPPQ